MAKEMTQQEADQALTAAGISIDWSKINWTLVGAFIRHIVEILTNMNPPMQNAVGHEDATTCLHESLCHTLCSAQIQIAHLKEHCPDDPIG